MTSPTPRSPGWRRSCHGTHSGGTSASGPGSSTVSHTVTCFDRGTRATVTAQRQPRYPGIWHSNRWVTRRVMFARHRGGAGEAGMTRLLDLHAISCAGDTLVTMGLAGTVFFSVAADAARGRVALYLLVTMAPFAIIAPVIGPVLDRYRHGRRTALAVTMFGRAFLAWLIADYIHGIGLYPAAFGVLVLSRAYGVARSAAVPRLLPSTLRLSEAGARASVFGTVAGALGAGALLATAIGTRLHIHRPALLQAGGLVIVTALGVVSLVRFNLLMLAALCMATAMASGLAKLAIDATIQERIAEQRRASA